MPSEPPDPPSVPADDDLPGSLELGAFSISLAVSDLATSQDFYQRLGIEPESAVEDEAGPGSLTVIDPDGNSILIDQFF